MSKLFQPLATGAIIAAMSGPALADVTPSDVFAQWTQYADAFGYQSLSEPEMQGDNLFWPEFSMSMEIPADPDADMTGGILTLTMENVAMTERGDGTVAIEVPESSTMTVVGDGFNGEDFTLTATLTAEGYDMVASGTPDDITYEFDSVRIGISLDEFDGKNGTFPTPGEMSVILEGMEGQSRVTSAGLIQAMQDFSIVKVTYNIDVTSPKPDEPGFFKWIGESRGITSTASGTFPPDMDMTDMVAAIEAGYAVDAQMKYTGGNSVMDFSDDETSFKLSTISEGGTFDIAMSAAGMTYDFLVNQLNFTAEGSDIPFPIRSGMAAFGLGISVPLMASDTDQTFGASLTLTEVELPPEVWMMADPGNALPHDPVTAELDVSGVGKLFVDLMDEEEMSTLGMTGGVPGEVSKLVIEKLLISAAGATIAADADLDVDNSAQSIFDPDMPAFGGTANLRLTGVTGLIDKLSQMGLIPPGPAMMASGMAKQLGKVETGPDDLSADVVLTKEGSLTVNGNPIPLQ